MEPDAGVLAQLTLFALGGTVVFPALQPHRECMEQIPIYRRTKPERDPAKRLDRTHSVAAVRAGEFRDLYRALVARGMREALARLTLTRKLAALTLRLWKPGERYDARKLTSHAVPAR